MDTTFNNHLNQHNHHHLLNHNGSSTTSSSTSSNKINYNNLLSAGSTTTTGIIDTTTSASSTSSTSPNNSTTQPNNPNELNSSTNKPPPASSVNHLIEHLVQQHQQYQQTLSNRNNHQMMFDSNSPQLNHKYLSNKLNHNNSHYVDLNAPTMPAPILHSTQPTTAFLVQTPNGSALLIPPQNGGTVNQCNNFSLGRNPYGITTIPLQNATLLNSNNNSKLPNSPSIISNFVNSKETNNSTNVYQTIDAADNRGGSGNYIYASDTFYDGTTTFGKSHSFHHTSSRLNSKRHQPNYQNQMAKLIENNSNSSTGSTSSNNNHTNTHNTNSNFFASPTLSITSNRRHSDGTLFSRIKYHIAKKLDSYCTWKFLAILFLFIILNLFLFIVYLGVMKTYNLNWHLKENHNSNSKKLLNSNSESLASMNAILFSKIGDTIEDHILPFEFLNVQFYLDRSSHIKFNLTFSKNSNVGIYANKNSLPTYTKFNFFETFNGYGASTKYLTKSNNTVNKLNKRAVSVSANAGLSNSMVNTGFIHFLEEGLWYISILNDNKNQLKFKIKTDFHEYINLGCPKNCNGKGECINGACKCFIGYTGIDCSMTACPVLCNGNGLYENGKCKCNYGWHGSECELSLDQCEVPDCNRNGQCSNGVCICNIGYDGKFCDKLSCHSPNCSNNGVCLNGKCVCFANFTGPDCDQITQTVVSLCNNNGEFDYASRACRCFSGWSGYDCTRNENCLDKSCRLCKNGWTGADCLQRAPFTCNSRCTEHGGICVNGTCNCSPGYQGRNCDINECPNSCNMNGICEKNAYNKYTCVCNTGWTGKACDIAIEMMCNDDIDNDKDGLTDCMDSECCVFDNCKLSLACMSSPEPKDRLLRKQPPSISVSFFEKMKFLIEDGSVQSFANTNSFSDSQVSVIRGQVLFKNGQPLIGVKVTSPSNPNYGYTLTRTNGIFDLMVNGGGSIVLEFSRNRLKTRLVVVNALWNQFLYIDPVVMYLYEDSNDLITQIAPCNRQIHNSTVVYPLVKTSWKEIRTFYYDNYLILPDLGVVRNQLNVIDTNLKLVYSSNLASGYQSTIFVLMTQSQIPEELQLVHLQIIVEGVLFKQTFEAYPNLNYEYSWDRRNAYEQRVYGFTNAKVMIGYQYEHCSFIYWQTSIVRIAGYDLGSSEIGNWNIDVHHRLNTQQGILHKGDGSTIYLREIQKNVETVAGKLNSRRDLDCSQCSLDQGLKFYSPYSISINKDGLIFIGDYNFVWMLNNSEPAKRILELNMDKPIKFHMANEPNNGNLFLTDPINRQILKVKNLDNSYINDLKSNVKIATEKSNIKYPKGLVFDNNGIIYFIDGNLIKSVNSDGTVIKIIGNEDQIDYKPMGCNMSYSIDKMRFYWPTSIAINPIDNNLYVLDENVIYKITQYNTIEVVMGYSFGCDILDEEKFLNDAIDMAFNPDGDLYILENNEKVKQIRILKSNGEIELFIGDNHMKKGYTLIDSPNEFSNFNNPIAIAIHQNRSVYVLDRGDNVLYHIRNTVKRDEYSGKYTIISPETREAFIFNRFGLHMQTIDLLNGNVLYNFTYSGSAFYGKLIGITDQNRAILNIKRDFHGRVESIQTINGFNIKLKLNNFDMLRSIITSDNRTYNFNYFGNSGLLSSKTELNDKTTYFVYEKNGKIRELIEPNNYVTNITYSINGSGIVSSINRKADMYKETWIANSTSIYVYKNSKLENIIDTNKNNVNLRTVPNEDVLSTYKQYFKTMLNFKQLNSDIKLRKDDQNRKKNNRNNNNNNNINSI